MSTLAALLDAEATLRDARVPVSQVNPGDRVVVHQAPPGEIVCSISAPGTVVSAQNLTPDRIHPSPWWAVVVALDAGDLHSFNCSANFSLLRFTDPTPAQEAP